MLSKLCKLLIALYVIAIPFNRGLVLPVVGEKIQLPELVFIFLALAMSPLCLQQLAIRLNMRSAIVQNTSFKTQGFRKLKAIDLGLILYFFAVIASYFFHPTRATLLDIVGLVYLLALYTIINLYFIFYENDATQIQYVLTRFSAWSLFILSGIGLFGFLILQFHVNSSLTTYYENYPFFGNVYRIRAFTQEPVMMASILSVFILVVMAGFHLKNFTKRDRQGFLLTLSMGWLALALTLTKSSVITFAAAFAIFAIQNAPLKKFTPYVWTTALSALLIFTHFVVVKKENFNNQQSYHGLVDAPSVSLGDYYLVETDYGSLKKAAFITGKRFWLTGVGSGNFIDYVPTLKKEGVYPIKFQDYDPISTYFGAFAELGIFGLGALLFLYFQVYKTLNQLKNQNPNDSWIASLIPIFGFMACESFVTDTMNFRQYWWVLACVAACVRITETYKSHTPQ